MDVRKFGATEIETSAVVFGGGAVGGIIINADDETRRKAIRMALDGGVNWIDTAPLYGNGKSEEALGWLLNEIDDDPIVSTKVGLDLNRLDDIGGFVAESMAASLSRLNRDSVDVVHLHNPITSTEGPRNVSLDDVMKPGGALDALEDLQRQGLTRYIGITALGDTADCISVISSGRIQSAQVYYNMINPTAARSLGHGLAGQDFAGMLAACREHGVGSMAIRIFAAGVLATDVRHGRESIITPGTDLSKEEQLAADAFAKLGVDGDGNTAYGTRAQTALRYVLAEELMDCAIFGLAELAHLEQVLGAAEAGPLPADAVAKLG